MSYLKNNDSITNRILSIRNTQVMLDKDIANLYGVKSTRLREQVKRNIERFPEDFMFVLTEEEVNYMVSQNAIPSKKHLGGSLPYVFTEQGVAALSGVLRSKKAVKTNIEIMRAFVAMRAFISKNNSLFNRLHLIEEKQLQYQIKVNKQFEKIFSTIEDKQFIKKQGIFFDGQIFDAYTFVSNLLRSANKSISLIDNYVDDSVLTLFSKLSKDVHIVIYTKPSKQFLLDLKKYNLQYSPITIREFTASHDRFIILDNETVYHFGASLKDLGKKWFAFSKFEKESFKIIRRLNITTY